MTIFLARPQLGEISKLSGRISGYRCTRGSASFVFTEHDKNTMGVIAVTAALADMGGQAASAVTHASDMEESADYLEFSVQDQPIKGWVWRSPFKEGDVVDVAVQWRGDYYEAFGVARPADKMIALYPHCSRARGRHIKNSIKWWAIFNGLFFGALGTWYMSESGLELLHEPSFYWIHGGAACFFILMFTSLSRQFMPFVRLAEKVFIALELPNPTNIDLVRSSKQQRTTNDGIEFGTFYFRY
jgi:hypothetical protein